MYCVSKKKISLQLAQQQQTDVTLNRPTYEEITHTGGPKDKFEMGENTAYGRI